MYQICLGLFVSKTVQSYWLLFRLCLMVVLGCDDPCLSSLAILFDYKIVIDLAPLALGHPLPSLMHARILAWLGVPSEEKGRLVAEEGDRPC